MNVCAVMLTRGDRAEYMARAIESFQMQTYLRRHLMIFGTNPADHNFGIAKHREFDGSIGRVQVVIPPNQPIGVLRNCANMNVPPRTDVIMHWDDDDYSYPHRIEEQVDLLKSAAAFDVECVGYNSMLFWKAPRVYRNPAHMSAEALDAGAVEEIEAGQAWQYVNPRPTYCLGTSLCYYRRTWERLPFQRVKEGEDLAFINALGKRTAALPGTYGQIPRMIARIHGENTASKIVIDRSGDRKSEWTRVPEWDETVRRIMES